ncbi:MAG: glutamyl-tRNA reductase [Gammaproteobacteria bacterium AqS3]|nr:glutamyl-tRNA reductase [Gammaproteobacteria bacterium AqS3]
MNLFVCGFCHATANLALRERFALSEGAAALESLCALDEVAGGFVLSTCNRTEIVADLCPAADGVALKRWLLDYCGVGDPVPEHSLYLLRGAEALRHVAQVGSGLDSQVLGEPQILGQLKDAVQLAVETEALSPGMHGLMQRVFGLIKQVRSRTDIGVRPTSIASRAVQLARMLLIGRDHSALLVGAGETAQLVGAHLRSVGIERIVVANRSRLSALHLAERLGGEAALLVEIEAHLRDVDVVISSTQSQLPVIGKGAVESAFRHRRRRPLLMFDLAVPRDIEPQVGRLADVYLYTLDDLRDSAEEGMAQRLEAAEEAQQLLEAGVRELLQGLDERASSELLRRYQSSAETRAGEVLGEAGARLAAGESPEDVLRLLSHRLTQTLMHEPRTWLRHLAREHPDALHSLGELDSGAGR